MGVTEIVLGIVLCVLAVVLIVCVLLQSGKEKSLSGTIAGAGENFFSQGKARSKDKILSRVTTILSFVFVVLVLVMYLMIAKTM